MLLVAHRGASAEAPENTLPAFKLAEELGVDAVEMDVHMTADGHLVVIHDDVLDRTTDGRGYVREKTLEEVKSLNASHRFADKFGVVRVPTLEEVLSQVRRARLFIEIKHSYTVYPGIEEKVLDLLEAYGAKNRAHLISFDYDSLERVREMDSTVETGIIYVGKARWMIDVARVLKASWLHQASNLLGQEDVVTAHRHGLRIGVWTVDWPEAAIRALRMGVDSLTTNDPRKMMRILRRQSM